MQPQDFSQLGIAAIPLFFRSKRPSVRWLKYQHTLPAESDLLRWFRPGRQTNAAVICGWQGLTVLDFDTTSDYLQWQAWALSEDGTARQVELDTYRVKTARGMHLYLFIDDCPRCGRFKWGDIKGQGGYVLIPPSVHPSGHVYVAVDDVAPILRVKSLLDVVPELEEEDLPQPPLPAMAPLRQVYQASALWPQTAIEQIRERESILSYFPDARATGKNRWYVAHCPWHDDRHESLWIDADKGLCGCYAGCTPRPLDVVGVYAKVHNLSNREAVKEMARCLT